MIASFQCKGINDGKPTPRFPPSHILTLTCVPTGDACGGGAPDPSAAAADRCAEPPVEFVRGGVSLARNFANQTEQGPLAQPLSPRVPVGRGEGLSVPPFFLVFKEGRTHVSERQGYQRCLQKSPSMSLIQQPWGELTYEIISSKRESFFSLIPLPKSTRCFGNGPAITPWVNVCGLQPGPAR